MPKSKLAGVLPLGIIQILAWASSYYLLALLANPLARDIGLKSRTVFAVFSGALLISALIGTKVGKTIDRIGGRHVLVLSNLFFRVRSRVACRVGLLAASVFGLGLDRR